MCFLWLQYIAIYLLGFITPNEDVNMEVTKKSIINHYQQYQAEQDFGFKKTSFDISENGFLRYKKTASNNLVEYYSVKLDKIEALKYLGSEKTGWLVIKCSDQSVIYQTYQDKNGNIDEMVDEIKIPIKNITVEELNKWVNDINSLIKKRN